MTSENAIAAQLLTVIREVYEGGRSIVGERWSLLKTMKEMADRSDTIGMFRYFEECLRSTRGKRVAEKLRAARKKTLETEEPRVWWIVGEALVEAKIDCVVGVGDVARRRRLAESFYAYWKKESVAAAIYSAVQRRLKAKRGILPTASLRPRLDAVPFVFMRFGGQDLTVSDTSRSRPRRRTFSGCSRRALLSGARRSRPLLWIDGGQSIGTPYQGEVRARDCSCLLQPPPSEG
jgi:hypothetical protein